MTETNDVRTSLYLKSLFCFTTGMPLKYSLRNRIARRKSQIKAMNCLCVPVLLVDYVLYLAGIVPATVLDLATCGCLGSPHLMAYSGGEPVGKLAAGHNGIA